MGITFLVLLALIGLGMWIPAAISTVAVGLLYLQFGVPGLQSIGLIVWGGLSNFSLTPIPLFIFMAELLLASGIATRLYRGLSLFSRRLPGGLLQTNVIGCAFFSAICGSSVATAAAIGAVSMPEMRRRNYPLNYSAATLAAGGTLGILIPPSIAFILYAGLTDTSIAQLFAAGLVPGLVLAVVFCAYIALTVRRKLASRTVVTVQSTSRWAALGDVLPVTVLMAVVLGSIYLGIATPTEAASVGCVMALALCAIYRRLTIGLVLDSALRTISASASILFIVAAALLFSYSTAAGNFTGQIASLLDDFQLDKYAFLVLMALIFIGLGCFIDSISLMLIVVPLVVPLLAAYGINPIWFGVFTVILIEMGLITPPVGLNLFVISGIAEIPIANMIAEVLPYLILFSAFIVTIALVPEIVLWFPSIISN